LGDAQTGSAVRIAARVNERARANAQEPALRWQARHHGNTRKESDPRPGKAGTHATAASEVHHTRSSCLQAFQDNVYVKQQQPTSRILVITLHCHHQNGMKEHANASDFAL
jgi:hypothetical protein